MGHDSRDTARSGKRKTLNMYHHLNFFITIEALILFMMPKTTAQGFNPTLHTRCINGNMNVSVRTEVPFRGVVYAEGHRNECSVTGFGSTETWITVPFAAMDRCGIRYDPGDEQYYVLLIVRQHPMIILQQDRVYNISCPRFNFQADSDENFSSESIQMGLFSLDNRKMHSAVFGSNYTLKVWVDNEQRKDFVVGSCQGFSEFNYTLELTNSNGCSRDTDIMSNFKYEMNGKVAVAQLYSMFKFPNQQIVHLQCRAVMCRDDSCLKPDCERRRDDPLVSNVGETREHSDSHGREAYSSTTVRVHEFGNVTEYHMEQGCSYQYSMLSAMCILFAILLTMAICLNIAFCALTGYCCCSTVDKKGDHQVEYVVADAKSIDALNSTVVREYATGLYGRQESLASHAFIGGSIYSQSCAHTDDTRATLVRRCEEISKYVSSRSEETPQFGGQSEVNSSDTRQL